ncbi:transcriptional regulator [Streptomyces sp. NBC_00083]|uniref:ArsR/SmtB family transcription factor n=1 Tax=Streptomyces sp. NBC_00083 TaxID=2975647 RepID=UPI0022541EE3|nr:helix-turn-helix domain-containing protein [Streptomyces sp. NBC_00083]MCX5383006.1 helix-turn-helix domain-containing protein [Streptomyces sp. NBC_00083]
MTDKGTRRITDVDTLKAFGHPLRMRLYRGLYIARTATASQLAEQVDEAVSLVSYHLRKLADHGLIEQAESPGTDGRERWWRLASEGISYRHEDFRDAPEKVAAHTSVTRLLVEQRMDLYRAYLDEMSAWSAEWTGASFSSEHPLRLTASELTELEGELDTVLKKFKERGDTATADGDTEGRENVSVHLYGFPFRF